MRVWVHPVAGTRVAVQYAAGSGEGPGAYSVRAAYPRAQGGWGALTVTGKPEELVRCAGGAWLVRPWVPVYMPPAKAMDPVDVAAADAAWEGHVAVRQQLAALPAGMPPRQVWERLGVCLAAAGYRPAG